MRYDRRREWKNLQGRIRYYREKGIEFTESDIEGFKKLTPGQMRKLRGMKLARKGSVTAPRFKGSVSYAAIADAERKIAEVNKIAKKYGGTPIDVTKYGTSKSPITEKQFKERVERTYRTRTAKWYANKDKRMVMNQLKVWKGRKKSDAYKALQSAIKKHGYTVMSGYLKKAVLDESLEMELFDSDTQTIMQGGFERVMHAFGFFLDENMEWVHELDATPEQEELKEAFIKKWSD